MVGKGRTKMGVRGVRFVVEWKEGVFLEVGVVELGDGVVDGGDDDDEEGVVEEGDGEGEESEEESSSRIALIFSG